MESKPAAQSPSLRVFISYSRRDSAFVARLAEGLFSNGFRPDFDQANDDPDNAATGISAEDEWWQRLQQMIALADVIVFVVSPDSAKSSVCDEEIAYARALNKRIIAILRRPIDFATAPPRLAALNVKLDFVDDGRFEPLLSDLCKALETDVTWLREHTRLGVIARRWEQQNQPKDLLLRGAELAAAEAWMARRRANAPEPSEALQALVTQSRRTATARQRTIVISSFVTAIAALTLSAYALWQQQIAETNEARAIEALKEQSILVANRSAAVAKTGMQLESVLLAAEVLPDQRAKSEIKQAWPYTQEAHASLLSAMTGKYSKAAFPEPVYGRRGASFSPDGKHLLSTTYRGGAAVWIIETGQIVKRLLGHSSNVNEAVYSPDGRLIATASVDETVRVWDTETWEVTHVLNANPSLLPRSFALERVLISNDNSFVVALLPNHVVKAGEPLQNIILMWPLERNAAPKVIHAQSDLISDFSVSPDSKILAIAGWNGVVQLISVSDGRLLRSFVHDNGTQPQASAVDFDDDHTSGASYRMLTAGRGGTGISSGSIRLWNIERNPPNDIAGDGLSAPELKLELRTNGSPESAEFSQDGNLILSSSSGVHAVELWDAKTGDLKSTLLQLQQNLSGVRLSPDGESFVIPNLSDGPVVWSVNQKSDLRTLFAGLVPVAAISEKENILAVSGPNGSVQVLSGPDYSKRRIFRGHSKPVKSLTFNSTGSRLFTSAEDGWLVAWDTKSGQQVWRDKDHTVFGAPGIKISNDDQWIASGRFASKEFFLRNANTGESIRTFDFYPDGLPNISQNSALKNLRPFDNYIAFSPDDRQIALADNLGAIQLWNVESGKKEFDLSGHAEGINTLVYHKSKALLLTSSSDGFVKLWDTSTGTLVKELTMVGQKVSCAQFDPEGINIVSASNTGTVRIWNLSGRQHVKDFLGHTSGVNSLDFNSDGTQLVTASDDGTAKIWDYPNGRNSATLQLNNFYNMKSASFSPNGRHVVGISPTTVSLWPDFQTIDEAKLQTTIERVQDTVERCMTPSQRKRYMLPPEPPRWCITGPGLEDEPDTARWKPKWPYGSVAWREWLAKRDAGQDPQLPWRFD